MSLKTATLIALIGIIVHLCIRYLYVFGAVQLHRISPVLAIASSLFSLMIFHGSIILFLAVFYFKQKEGVLFRNLDFILIMTAGVE